MSNCATVSANGAPLAPNKRVHYNFGMVLGVDEFRQEQEHQEWKQRLSNLLLHGYGTVCGLGVSAHAINTDVEIRVAAGYALSPRGRWIWVDRIQCAQLNRWLRTHPLDLSPPGAGRQSLYVTLCYVECDVDLVPIAGTACADDETTRAPSRTLESFRIAFDWAPPPQPGEDAARAFGALLGRVQIVPGSPPGDGDTALLEAVRALGQPDAAPGSPPTVEPFELAADAACDTMREALAIWATEVCPRLQSVDGAEQCLLLACLDVELNDAGELVFAVDSEGELLPGSVVVDNCVRPILVSDRLKQELFCLIDADAGGGGGGPGPPGPPGPGIVEVTLEMPPSGLPSASLANVVGGQRLDLVIPAPGNAPGEPGPGIVEVTLDTPPSGTPSANLADVPGGRRLDLVIPIPAGTPGEPGAGVVEVTLDTTPGGAPGASLTDVAGGRRLDLVIPVPLGNPGEPGVGIVDVTISTPPGGTASASLTDVPGGRRLDLVIPIPPAAPGSNVIASGDAQFTAPQNFNWGQLDTQREAIDLDRPAPLTMIVVRVDPDDFFSAGDGGVGNVALTAALIDDRVNIVATNLSRTRLRGLVVRWWAFQE